MDAAQLDLCYNRIGLAAEEFMLHVILMPEATNCIPADTFRTDPLGRDTTRKLRCYGGGHLKSTVRAHLDLLTNTVSYTYCNNTIQTSAVTVGA